jgi:hypothetical protein
MQRVLALIGLSLMVMLGTAAPAEARHCGRPCYDQCASRDCCSQQNCCRRKVCHPVYRYETRKVFAGWRYDCDGCRHATYRYERVKVYAGKRCTWSGGRSNDDGYAPPRDDGDDDAYRPRSYTPAYGGPDYSGEGHAFPNYEGTN